MTQASGSECRQPQERRFYQDLVRDSSPFSCLCASTSRLSRNQFETICRIEVVLRCIASAFHFDSKPDTWLLQLRWSSKSSPLRCCVVWEVRTMKLPLPFFFFSFSNTNLTPHASRPMPPQHPYTSPNIFQSPFPDGGGISNTNHHSAPINSGAALKRFTSIQGVALATLGCRESTQF